MCIRDSPTPAIPGMASTAASGHDSTARDSRQVHQPGLSGISAGFPGEQDVERQCHSTAETSDIGIGAGRQWQHPVLQAVLEVVVASVSSCEELEGEFDETEAGGSPSLLRPCDCSESEAQAPVSYTHLTLPTILLV